MLGTNQSGVRDHNERLVLSILRRDGALAKADIARRTGLSAQTISVIMRALEEDGMLLRDAPRRGKVGQPSVPMRLNPDGAYFFGGMIGRRWTELVLVDMTGTIRSHERIFYDYPVFDEVLEFLQAAADRITAGLSLRERARLSGFGVALPYNIWDWAEEIDAPVDALLAWRDRDIGAELGARTGFEVLIQNDASAACAAELVFGQAGTLPEDFLHIFVGFFVGGGLVIGNHLFAGRTGNAGAVGSLPIPQPDGTTRQLIDLASLYGLAEVLIAEGRSIEELWKLRPEDWAGIRPEVQRWIKCAAPALAQAILSTVALLDVGCVLIDGHLPDEVRTELVAAVDTAVAASDFAGLRRPQIRAGTLGAESRSLGAASLPLAARFLV